MKVTVLTRLREMVEKLDKAGEHEAAAKILDLLDDPGFRQMARLLVIKEGDDAKE